MTTQGILVSATGMVAEQLRAGTAERIGVVVRDKVSKQIIGHLQETGMLQSALGKGFSGAGALLAGGPLNVVSVIQNQQIKGKLDAMQAMLGGMQTLQLVSLVTSVAGIGITVASTAMILSRIKAVDSAIASVEEKVTELPARWREMELRKTLTRVESQLERLATVGTRRDPRLVVERAEEALHEGFSQLYAGIVDIVVQQRVDPNLLRSLLTGLSVCGSAQIKALVWMNEMAEARDRARIQSRRLEQLALKMPRDLLGARLSGGAEAAALVASETSEIRFRIASLPSLAESLLAQQIDGRAYIEAAEAAREEPVMLLPVRAPV